MNRGQMGDLENKSGMSAPVIRTVYPARHGIDSSLMYSGAIIPTLVPLVARLALHISSVTFIRVGVACGGTLGTPDWIVTELMAPHVFRSY